MTLRLPLTLLLALLPSLAGAQLPTFDHFETSRSAMRALLLLILASLSFPAMAALTKETLNGVAVVTTDNDGTPVTDLAQDGGDIVAQNASVLRDVRRYLSAVYTVAPTGASAKALQFADYTCDGTADDVQIQAALDAAEAAGGGTVLLLAGDYTVAATLTIASNVRLAGEGMGSTTVTAATALDASVLQNDDRVSGDTGILVQDITFDGNKANQTTAFSTVDLLKVTHSQLVRVGATGALRTGTFPTVSSDGEGLVLRECQYVSVLDGRYYDNVYDGIKTRDCLDVLIQGNLCDENGRAGIQIAYENTNAEPSERISVIANRIYHSTGTPTAPSPTTSGVYLHTGQKCIVEGNWIEGPGQGIGLTEISNDNLIANNICRTRYNAQTKAILDVEGASGTPCLRNKFIGNKLIGISGAAGEIASTDSNDDDNTFENNEFYLEGGSGTWTVENAGDDNHFLMNRFGTYTMNDTGTAMVNVRVEGGTLKVTKSDGTTVVPDGTDADVTVAETFDNGSGAIPTGWATLWSTTDVTWAENASEFMRATKTSAARTALEWTEAGSAQDFDAVYKVRTSASGGTATYAGMVFRASGAAGSENAYVVSLASNGGASTLLFGKYVSGTFTTLVNASKTWSADTYYYIRVNVSGTAVKARLWAASGSEPGTWDIDTTDGDITAAGAVALFGFAIQTADWDYIAINEGGTAALE